MRFTVACAQIAPEKAKVEANLDKIAESIIQASSEGADLVVFPEAATTAYFLEGGVVEGAITSLALLSGLSKRLETKLSRSVDAVIGFYETDSGGLYNSAAYLQLGKQENKVVYVYKKFFLPSYGVFDEERFVSRGQELGVFDTRLGRVAILICEDIWHSILSTLAAAAGAQLILVPSASPARDFSGPMIGNLAHYERMITSVSAEHGVFCVNCQLTGFEGGKGLAGGSAISGPNGQIIARGPEGEEYLLLASLDFDDVTIARANLPLISDLQSAWQDIVRLVSARHCDCSTSVKE
jgi:predicted amidohydrolase